MQQIARGHAGGAENSQGDGDRRYPDGHHFFCAADAASFKVATALGINELSEIAPDASFIFLVSYGCFQAQSQVDEYEIVLKTRWSTVVRGCIP